jgi:hypothetical protein
MNRDIIKKLFPAMLKHIDNMECPTCGKPIVVEDFKDKLSVKEFGISGMCESCQSKAFHNEDEE